MCRFKRNIRNTDQLVVVGIASCLAMNSKVALSPLLTQADVMLWDPKRGPC